MFRNILFVLFFILVYGAIFLLGSYSPPSVLTDRAENGTFTAAADGSIVYRTDLYGLELSYDPDWIVFDGLQLEKQFRDHMTEAEIEESFGCPIGDLAFLGGFLTPQASLRVTAEKGNAIPAQSFTASDIHDWIDKKKTEIIYAGGSWGNGSGYILPAQGNGERIILLYYDYKYLGEYCAVFTAMLNVKGNIVYLDGYYNDLDGLAALTDFVKNGLRVTASGNSAV